MTRTLVTGATGTLGEALQDHLLDAGHHVVAASRSPPAADERANVEWVELDLAAGGGVETAVADADVVIHTATAPQGDTEAVDVDGTQRLADAAAEAGVGNVVYPSIVGVEEIPLSYYEHKRAAEKILADGDVGHTIVRVTQFHSFVADLLGTVAKLPVWPLPTRFQVQPIDVREAAEILVGHATPDPAGRVPNVGGPAVHSLGALARSYRSARGLRRPVVRLPVPGSVAAGFRAGHSTCSDRAVGTVRWEAWLAERYGGDRETAPNPTGSPS